MPRPHFLFVLTTLILLGLSGLDVTPGGAQTITGRNIVDGSIGTVDLANQVITTQKLALEAVTTSRLQDGAVTGGKIRDQAVTTKELRDGAVTAVKLAPSVLARLNALEDRLEAAERTITNLRTALTEANSTIRTLSNRLTTVRNTVNAFDSRLAAVEGNPLLGLGPYVQVETAAINGLLGPHVLFERVNVHIRSGAGTTDGGVGLGNLVVGYNEADGGVRPLERTGVHNVIVGRGHRFTSVGGIVAGNSNEISGDSASVTGGQFNTASGNYASVSGGAGRSAPASANWAAGGLFEDF